VLPKEHNGIMIRIGDSSGTLFDDTFMRYQIAERTRLGQITAEIFVRRGLDAALNIDRESFNFAHPHYQFLMRWVHRSLTQVATRMKEMAANANQCKRDKSASHILSSINKVRNAEIKKAGADEDFDTGSIEIVEADTRKPTRKDGVIRLDSKIILEPVGANSTAPQALNKREEMRQRISAVADVLNAYGLLEDMPYTKQQDLLRAIVAIFSATGDE